MIDVAIFITIIAVMQSPLYYALYLRDVEIKRLNTALLRVERPTAAVIAERPSTKPAKTPEQMERDKESLKTRIALWSR